MSLLLFYHGIPKWSGLEGTFQSIQFQTPCQGERHHPPLSQVAPGPVQPVLGHFQGWGSCSFSGQTMPGPHHHHREEFLPINCYYKNDFPKKQREKPEIFTHSDIYLGSFLFQACPTAPGEAQTLLNSPVRNATQLCCTPDTELASLDTDFHQAFENEEPSLVISTNCIPISQEIETGKKSIRSRAADKLIHVSIGKGSNFSLHKSPYLATCCCLSSE